MDGLVVFLRIVFVNVFSNTMLLTKKAMLNCNYSCAGLYGNVEWLVRYYIFILVFSSVSYHSERETLELQSRKYFAEALRPEPSRRIHFLFHGIAM